ncbi:APC family permease [Sphingomonas sp.]|uniref:APC family permease n=1 Tax=Sphingomonas sp. TaxID=28214 RepID=UPI0018454FFC|nr:APC family permease [Sphingomonas sp.]MBA3511758.1 APC family permease [Sphingomonas sp.]
MSEPPNAARLERRIGLGGAILLSFNGVLGGGIFAMPAILAADFGSFSPWLFPLVAFASLLIIVPFARSAGAFPQSGGPAAYGAVFGRFVGFELGWIYYIARTAAFAANANVLTAYVARWWTGADQGVGRAVLMLSVCAILAAVNIAGVKKALALLGGLTLLKALPLLGAALAVLALTVPWPTPGPMPPLSELEAGVLLVFYAFVGFENVVVPAGETKRPRTVLPRAIFTTIALTTLLYFLVQLAFISALPGGTSDDKAPLIDLGRWLAGPTGAVILTVAAIASLSGNLHGIMTSTSRVTSALGERGDLPRWFARVHPRFLTPHNSIAFLAFFAAALALVGTYVWLAVISVLARLIIYAVTIAALPRAPERGAVPAWLYAMGAAGIALCLWASSRVEWEAWQTLGLLALAGAALYAIARRGAASSEGEAVSAIQPPPSSRDPS